MKAEDSAREGLSVRQGGIQGGRKVVGITRAASAGCRVCAFTRPDLIGWTPSLGA